MVNYCKVSFRMVGFIESAVHFVFGENTYTVIGGWAGVSPLCSAQLRVCSRGLSTASVVHPNLISSQPYAVWGAEKPPPCRAFCLETCSLTSRLTQPSVGSSSTTFLATRKCADMVTSFSPQFYFGEESEWQMIGNQAVAHGIIFLFVRGFTQNSRVKTRMRHPLTFQRVCTNLVFHCKVDTTNTDR